MGGREERGREGTGLVRVTTCFVATVQRTKFAMCESPPSVELETTFAARAEIQIVPVSR